MSRYIIKPAGAEHDKELAEISGIAMPGMISLALEKSPSYLAAMHLKLRKPGSLCVH
ncbi:MAG: hypothetical protein U5L96_06170 [Owenweeksia sp.]|nr:hypothetical protein [Owenweeksia sp.]